MSEPMMHVCCGCHQEADFAAGYQAGLSEQAALYREEKSRADLLDTALLSANQINQGQLERADRFEALYREAIEALEKVLRFDASFGENDIPEDDRARGLAVLAKARAALKEN